MTVAMNRYIALLRGVNISGKNKISMQELKEAFTELSFVDVLTHLNSGNVAFEADESDELVLAEKISKMIKDHFEIDIPVLVILQEKLRQILSGAPEWWGTNDKNKYDNLIFVLPCSSAEIIAEKIGEPSKDSERIFIYKNTIFWTFDRAKYSKANWWKKTASKGIGEMLTIRTATTLKKIAEM